MTFLSARMSDYPTISHGKTRIPGINDGEEFEDTNVSLEQRKKRDEVYFQNTCT
jgi:myosin heavy subunit